MKRNCLILIVILFLLSSCDGQLASVERVSFDNSFPKPNKDLETLLGNELKLTSGSEILDLAISSAKDANLITEVQTGDTLFYGKVSKFRGLYYFSQAINDSSYLIHAVKISGNLIYGLTSVWQQTALIDKEVRKGNLPKLVRYISPDSSTFRLRTDKREMRKFYSHIISTIKPDTILQYQQKLADLKAIASVEEPIDGEESELFYKVYPNPVSDFVNVDLQKSEVGYHLIDLNGKTVATGNLSKQVSSINTATLIKGVYILTLTGPEAKSKEYVRLVKN